MQRASPQSLANAIWKSALLLLLFEQSYYKVKSKLVYTFYIFSYCTYVVSFTLYLGFEKNKLFDYLQLSFSTTLNVDISVHCLQATLQ